MSSSFQAVASEQKREELKARRQKKKHRGRHKQGHRVEIWISADGATNKDEFDDSDDEDLHHLSAVEVNK